MGAVRREIIEEVSMNRGRAPQAITALLALAVAVSLFSGCDEHSREQVTAMVVCDNACRGSAACGSADCVARCRALAGDELLLAGCSGCLFAADDSCDAINACVTACDPGLLEDPECVAFCSVLSAACERVSSCMGFCLNLGGEVRTQCLACYQRSETTCGTSSTSC